MKEVVLRLDVVKEVDTTLILRSVPVDRLDEFMLLAKRLLVVIFVFVIFVNVESVACKLLTVEFVENKLLIVA